MKAFLIGTFLAICMQVNAQIQWKPAWNLNDSCQLEYIYSFVLYDSDHIAKSDSSHCLIDVKYLSENDSSYILQWRFHHFKTDTTKITCSVTEKRQARVYSLALEKCPFIMSMAKSNFHIRLLNQRQIDSVFKEIVNDGLDENYQNSISGVETYPFFYIGGFKSIIDGFYNVYTRNDLIPNLKLAADKSGEWYSGLNPTGYSLLDSNSVGVYKWKRVASIDVTKSTKAVQDLVLSIDSTSHKQKQEEWKRPEFYQISTFDSEVTIRKSDMQIANCHMHKTSKVSSGNSTSHSVQIISIRLIK